MPPRSIGTEKAASARRALSMYFVVRGALPGPRQDRKAPALRHGGRPWRAQPVYRHVGLRIPAAVLRLVLDEPVGEAQEALLVILPRRAQPGVEDRQRVLADRDRVVVQLAAARRRHRWG